MPGKGGDDAHQRSPRRTKRAKSKGEDDDSSSPQPSSGSWNFDRGRSRVRRPSNPFSEENLRRRGYHSILSSFGKVFHLEKRWKLRREMGSGAYGVVISAADEISGETVAIKLVTRVFEKVQLAKRALREITLLRHFASHENITGLIDVDAISPDFNEIYIFMEPMEADLHQIIKSGQTLSNEHVQYFVYQILRGMKYVHSASVIHRDLKPGNLLVNADCELKICDFGLSRGYESKPDENATHLTEYVATRWYRAPEIMLAFRRYDTAIDVWSIGCILAELLMGKPIFKGKDYVDQLNKIFDVLGTPDEYVIKKIVSEKARAYVRSLPRKRRIAFDKIIPHADPQALDLLAKMLTFDPSTRITVPQALEHPWLASYHDEADEPTCPRVFDKWKQIEELETLDDFRKALWDEIEDYRRDVRGISDMDGVPIHRVSVSGGSAGSLARQQSEAEQPFETGVILERPIEEQEAESKEAESEVTTEPTTSPTIIATEPTKDMDMLAEGTREEVLPAPEIAPRRRVMSTDPVMMYARRSSILQPSRQGSTYNSPVPGHQRLSFIEGPMTTEPGALPAGGIAFPSMQQQGYVVPARSRTGSMAGGEVTRKVLRTLSTVSIHESAEGIAGGLAQIAPIGRFIVEAQTTADAPASEMPDEFARDDPAHAVSGDADIEGKGEKASRKFQVG